MPDLKISGLSELTGADTASGDLIPIVDVSDTATMSSASGATKRITRDQLGAALNLAPQVVESKNADFVPVASDAGKLILMNKSSAQQVTVNTSLGLSVGQRIDFVQYNANQVSFVASGVNLRATPGSKLRAQWSACSLICMTSGEYLLTGDLTA